MADLIERDALREEMRDCEAVTHSIGYSDMIAILDDAPAVNRWISVEDALPNDRKCVLVTDGEDIEITYFDGSDWEMRDQYGNHYELYGAVTHWMPLPEQPKE